MLSLHDFHKHSKEPFYQIHIEICAVSALSLAVTKAAHESKGGSHDKAFGFAHFYAPFFRNSSVVEV